MPASFRTTRIVEFADTDMAGIIHFASYFRYMEAAEHAFLRSLGLSVVMEWQGVPVGMPRVAASCEYLRPARFEDVLTVAVVVQKVGRSSVAYAFEFFHGEELLARGQMKSVFCRMAGEGQLQALEIPANIRSLLEPVQA